MHNPFYFRELPLTAPFCDREQENKQLMLHAHNKANVVMFSPRRYGKTSLVKRVQERLRKQNVITVYVDLFGVDSVDDLSGRLAARLYAYCRESESLLKRAMRFLSSWRPVLRPDPESGVSLSVEMTTRSRGVDLLTDTLSGLGSFMAESGQGMHIVLDEFQEIGELRESLQIEGVMRSHVQTHENASYFFVGSRRRMLKDIFNERKRPFYQSAVNFPLGPLPQTESVAFIMAQFAKGGKRCSGEIARKIAVRVEGYPYYIQRVPYTIFELTGKTVTEENVAEGFRRVIDEERPVYEAMLQSLAPQQIKLLRALSEEPTDKPFSAPYMASHGLGSVGGVQGAIRRLIDLDYVEKTDGTLRVVDPVFSMWVRALKTGA
jgi:hypothetical protein